MPPRFFVDQPLSATSVLNLPASVARHVQVLRLQPGSALTLFNGDGGEWAAQVLRIGRAEVEVGVLERRAVNRELALRVTLALGMPANERMDTLVEKACELGVSTVQPLLTERSVLRLSGERAERKRAHWQAIAVAACEQSGRSVVPQVAPVLGLAAWAQQLDPAGDDELRWLLSVAQAPPLRDAWHAVADIATVRQVLLLSGPEGGLSAGEEALARGRLGCAPVSLGPRVLRADTAPLAALAQLALLSAA